MLPLDVGLPGLELAQHMLPSHPYLPIVLYTGYRETIRDETARKIVARAAGR